MTGAPVTVLIAEDHQLVSDGLAALLEGAGDVTVVGQVGTAERAASMAVALAPDVVLMDYRLPDSRGALGIQGVLRACPRTRVLVVTASREDEALAAVLEAGAMGFLHQDSGAEDLLTAVRAVAGGEAYFTRAAMAAILSRRQGASHQALSPREVEVLQALADGRSVAGIAGDLHLSQHTVRNHIRSAMARLEVHTALDAVVHAVRAGLVDIGSGTGR
ncbi:response regulator transcription factor [Kineosporiaceae bacterium SCSIO 59966]|nr:response regulator transcription factor [Kineosporiaceae bacterium SCSIO 59966]